MDPAVAAKRLEAERADILRTLEEDAAALGDDQSEGGRPITPEDQAQSLTTQGVDDAVTTSLHDRLAAIERAQQRLRDGTYGRSVRSGVPLSDERLTADPAAELTVEEAEA